MMLVKLDRRMPVNTIKVRKMTVAMAVSDSQQLAFQPGAWSR